MADQIPVKANLTSGAATSLGQFATGDTVPVVNGGTGVTSLSALKTAMSLSNVDNTADAAKPVSTAQQTALNLKAPLASPSFTGSGGITGGWAAAYLSSSTSADITGALNVGGTLSANGVLRPTQGVRCFAGAGLGEGGNTYSLFWTGSAMNVYVDSTYLGTMNITSDERVKKDVALYAGNRSAFEGISVVTYDFASIGIFSPSGRTQLGFSAQNLTGVFPLAVVGDVTAVDEDGSPKPASVVDRPILALTVLEVQALIKEVAALRAEVAALREGL